MFFFLSIRNLNPLALGSVNHPNDPGVKINQQKQWNAYCRNFFIIFSRFFFIQKIQKSPECSYPEKKVEVLIIREVFFFRKKKKIREIFRLEKKRKLPNLEYFKSKNKSLINLRRIFFVLKFLAIKIFLEKCRNFLSTNKSYFLFFSVFFFQFENFC